MLFFTHNLYLSLHINISSVFYQKYSRIRGKSMRHVKFCGGINQDAASGLRSAGKVYAWFGKVIQCLYWTGANGDSSVDEASTTMNVHVRQGSQVSRCFYADVPVIYSRSFGRTWMVRSEASRYVKLAHISCLSSSIHRFMCMRII